MVGVNASAARVFDVLVGIKAPQERTFRNKVIGLVSLQRVVFSILVLPLPFAVAVLAGVGITDPVLVPLCIVTFLAVGVVMATNDIIDAERDKRKWPQRALATGLLSKSEAVLFTMTLGVITLVMSVVAVNVLLAMALLMLYVLNYVYSKYGRDSIGYVTVLLPVVGMIVAQWVAISPSTLLSPLPLLIFIIVGANGLAVEITHEALDPTIPALFVRPRPNTERALYIVLVIFTFVVGIGAFMRSQLPWPLLVLFAVFSAWMLSCAKDLGENRTREKVIKAYEVVLLNFTLRSWLFVVFFGWIPQHVSVL